MAEIVAVHLYAQWERYAEERLTEALVKHSSKFLDSNGIRRMKSIHKNLALVFVREGHRYFDFRSTGELMQKSDRLVGSENNPLRRLTAQLKSDLDTLGAIRNHIVHLSDSAGKSYNKRLSTSYGLISSPYVQSFLTAIDRRKSSPARNKERIIGLMEILRQAVLATS